MNSVIFIKLGGSLITDKRQPFTLQKETITRLADEIKSSVQANPSLQLVVGNGAGSFAHVPAHEYHMTQGVTNDKQKEGFAKVQDAASRLNRVVVEALIKAGVNAISFNPSSMIVAKNGELKSCAIDSLLGVLDLGMMPVMYGDIVFDEVKGCSIFSTEKLFREMVRIFKGQNRNVLRIIYCGNTDGVLDSNGQTIKMITPSDLLEIKEILRETPGYDVTGGMLHKVQESLYLAKQGIKIQIINGEKKNVLKETLLELTESGTSITAVED